MGPRLGDSHVPASSGRESHFTQPRAHSLANLYTVCRQFGVYFLTFPFLASVWTSYMGGPQVHGVLAREAQAALRHHRQHVGGVHLYGHAAFGPGTLWRRYLPNLRFQRVARLHDHLRILRTPPHSHSVDESCHSQDNLHPGTRSIGPETGMHEEEEARVCTL